MFSGKRALLPILAVARSIWRNKTYIGFIVLFTLLTAEIGGQFFFPFKENDRFYIFPPYHSFYYESNSEYTPGVFNNARFQASSLGIRSDEYEDEENVILVLGGSTGLDQLLDQKFAWPQRVQDKLNASGRVKPVWVGNLSRSSRASKHNIDYFETIVPYMPKANVILVLVGVNDFQYYLRSSYGTYTAEQELSFNYSVVPQNSIWDRIALVRMYDITKNLYNRSKYAFISGTGGIKMWRDCRQSVDGRDLIGQLADMSEGLSAFRANLNRLVDMADSYGTRLVFITQPTLWREDIGEAEKSMLIAGGVGSSSDWCEKREYYSVDALMRGMRAFNEVTRAVCDSRSLKCVDLAETLPPRAEFFYDDMHYSEAGADKVADIIVENLLGLTPPFLD